MLPLSIESHFLDALPVDPSDDPRPRQVWRACASRVSPHSAAAPRLLAYSPSCAALLGLESHTSTAAFLDTFSGNQLHPDMQPYAMAYGGHQFGHWAGQLGDGRAIALGEVRGLDTQRYTLQLKGAGPTPYSRHADGFAVLRSSIREFLCSEAMHYLGVPSTRVLSLIATGNEVVRDQFYDGNPRPEPGAVVCRVSPSFLRFGHFELPASRQDPDTLRELVRYALQRDYPDIDSEDLPQACAEMFRQVCERTATLMVHWMRVGFVHGVMNTDNLSLIGETIDYGPYGWLEETDREWTPNTTDSGGRYSFGRQSQVALWNLSRLAGALLPIIGNEAPLYEALEHYEQRYSAQYQSMMADKLGLSTPDEAFAEQTWLLMEAQRADMTLFFRTLSAPLAQITPAALAATCYGEPQQEAFESWWQQYRLLADGDAGRSERMRHTNPSFVLKNYLVQQAIEEAEQGEMGRFAALHEAMRHPYDEPASAWVLEKRPAWASTPGCSQLSCSS